MNKKKEFTQEKVQLHVRNKHRARYNFKQLAASYSGFASFVRVNEHGNESIDFSNPAAVKALNKALLIHFYGLTYWDIPENYLCPPIPGRADYIHHIADLLSSSNGGKIPLGSNIRCIDIGTGANCIYPIIGSVEYKWQFVGTDIDPVAIESATKTIELNAILNGNCELRLQPNANHIYKGVFLSDEYFDVSVCNPPFHASYADAQAAALKKITNLNHSKSIKLELNFGGKRNELWCKGGEEEFVKSMIRQSVLFGKSCFWFTSLISKQSTLKPAYYELSQLGATEVQMLPMHHGNKISRILAWTFLDKAEQKKWIDKRWGEY